MSLAYVGPVVIGPYHHGNPSFSWVSNPTAGGIRGASIGGLVTWAEAEQLEELADNPDRVVWCQGASGVLEYVYFDGARFARRSGWYLLDSVSFSPEKRHTVSDYTAPVTIKAASLGQRQPVVVSTSRLLDNDFALVGQPILVDPFWNEDAGGGQMLVSVGGSTVAREYDDTSPMVWP